MHIPSDPVCAKPLPHRSFLGERIQKNTGQATTLMKLRGVFPYEKCVENPNDDCFSYVFSNWL